MPLAKNKNIFILGITNGDDRNFAANTFQRTLRQSGYKFESVILDERSTAEEINAARKKAGGSRCDFDGTCRARAFGREKFGGHSRIRREISERNFAER